MFNVGDRVKVMSNCGYAKCVGTVVAYHNTTWGGGNPVVMVKLDSDNRLAADYGVAFSPNELILR
jgi:hypothetical protein